MISSDAGSASPVSVRTALPRATIWPGESGIPTAEGQIADRSSLWIARTLSSVGVDVYQRIALSVGQHQIGANRISFGIHRNPAVNQRHGGDVLKFLLPDASQNARLDSIVAR